MAVYIIKFMHPEDSTRKVGGRAAYYIGYCESKERVYERYLEHIGGYGAKICAAAVQQGFTLTIAWVFPRGGRQLEAYLKERHETARILARLYAKTFKYPDKMQMKRAADKRKTRYFGRAEV